MNNVASVSEAPQTSNQMEDFIAAVFPSLSSGTVGDGSFSDNSDSSFAPVSPTPPLKSKHFIWNCTLTGPAVTFPINKPSLIDNGCHMVLIRPDLVDELGLPILTLENPEHVNVAISFSKAALPANTKLLYIMLNFVPLLLILFFILAPFTLLFALAFACLLFLGFCFYK